MRKKIGILVGLACVLILTVPQLNATENIIKFFERFNSPFITQGEWAVYLVKATGQGDQIPTGSSEVDYLALLEKNNIAPLDGWQLKNYLTFGDKAVTMVQALDLTGLLPDDPEVQHYIWLMESMGFHEGTPNELVKRTDALQLNINDPIYQEPVGNNYHIQLSPLTGRGPDEFPSLDQ